MAMLPTDYTVKNRKRKYKKNRKKQEGSRFYMTRTAIGRTVKISLMKKADERLGVGGDGVLHNGDYKSKGLTEEWLWLQMEFLFPWYPEYYLGQTGEDLTKHKLIQRCRMPTQQAESRSEHFLFNKKLIPLVPAVDSLLKRNMPITRQEAFIAGSFPEESFNFLEWIAS